MATTVKTVDSDAQVTFEDQQKINKFARCNAKLQDVKQELKEKQKAVENLQDAEEELLLLSDEDGLIPYQIGEVFVSMTIDDTNQMLEKAKESSKQAIKDLESKAEEHKAILQQLKVELYAKFGTNINLEAEED